MLEIEPYGPADLPVIEQFIAAERELDPRLSPGIELAADGLMAESFGGATTSAAI